MNFNTTNNTFRQLMGNGVTYRVPPFQRDYSWSTDEWDDLWQDIQALFAEDAEPAHYMGYLVLQSADNKLFEVIDGQQRLTTLSLMLLAAIPHLTDLAQAPEPEDPQMRRARQLRDSYIGYLDPVSLLPRSKLMLNRHNDSFYQNYLVPLQRLPQRGLNASEHLLRKGFVWFKERIKLRAGSDGEAVARFVDQLVDKLFFTVITVTDELNAFKVFETLNARGVRLSSTDLLQNYLFSVIHREGVHGADLKVLEDRWERIVGLLGSESFPEFLRVFWNSRRELVRKADLFKTMRRSVTSSSKVFALIRDLDRCARIYAALRTPSDGQWSRCEGENLRLLQMFNVRQPLAVLLSAFDAFEEADRHGFERFLRTIVVLSFRYNVICNRQGNEQERIYNEIARRIASGGLESARDAVAALRPLYPEDQDLRTAFADKELRTTNSRNNKIARYILFNLEKRKSGSSFDVESASITLEHVLPEHPEDGWSQFDDALHERAVYRLGNLALLNAASNREIGNASYLTKREVYRQSEFATTRKIAEDYDDWTIEKIQSRQAWMAKQATAIWQVSFG